MVGIASLGHARRSAGLQLTPADVIIYRDGDYAIAVDTKTKETILKSKDHAEVIQTGIDNLPYNGVMYLDGEFKITSPITVKSNIRLFGGRLVQKMDNEPIFKSPASSWNDAIENIMFYDMEFDVDSNVTTSHAGIGLAYAKEVVVTHCRFLGGIGSGVYASLLLQPVQKAWILYNKAYGPSNKSAFIATMLGSDRSSHVYMLGNYAEDFGDTGVGVLNTDNGIVMGNVTLKGANKAGGVIDLSGSTNLLVTNNVVILDKSDTTRFGIYYRSYTPSGGTFQKSKQLTIANNYVEAYKGIVNGYLTDDVVISGNIIFANDKGIEADGGVGHRIIGNIVEANNFGIYMHGVSDAVIEANKVIGSGVSGSYAIFVSSYVSESLDAKYNVIRNNYIENWDYGLTEWLDGGTSPPVCDYNIFMKNILSSIATGEYHTNVSSAGTHSFVDIKTYTSLPTDGIVMKNTPILYYDGTYYYLAVWNGSAWVKVQLA